ncbi:sigma-70 family RNA polymerase sigma factor [Alkalihalobacillus sp. MEB130]|uniref:sigma-70 family RNA polymerase sigma factor n=1 Tax=Alkalihalobacillus sp. MEB130 TaxID=2976704 RepID=UPI0028DD4F96|nr:sigma-70 family RNA polymerase sigma factor [Alkalihalobacillus sp. MEB130]MDT8860366.1 sigma-70 family RNA polymerase sigma factor [Alkalihalobacillus sp. MEB130]
MYKEEETFDVVLENYEPMIKKQMVSLRIYKDFDEFLQLGRIALWEAYERFDPSKGNFSTFAISTVRGKFMTLLTKETKYAERNEIADDVRFAYIPSEWEMTPLEQEMLDSYTVHLTDREKTWVHEAIFLQKHTNEIAATYGVSPISVRQWKQSALKKMRHHLGSDPSAG